MHQHYQTRSAADLCSYIIKCRKLNWQYKEKEKKISQILKRRIKILNRNNFFLLRKVDSNRYQANFISFFTTQNISQSEVTEILTIN